MRGKPQNQNLFIKKMCIYSSMFKLQSSSKSSPLDAVHLSRCFSHCSEQFLTLSIWMPFSASAGFLFVFCFTYSNRQSFSIWGLRPWGVAFLGFEGGGAGTRPSHGLGLLRSEARSCQRWNSFPQTPVWPVLWELSHLQVFFFSGFLHSFQRPQTVVRWGLSFCFYRIVNSKPSY